MSEYSTMEDSQSSNSSSSFSEMLARKPTIFKRVETKKQHLTRTVDSSPENIEEDPSPHAQPPFSTPSLESNSDQDSTYSARDDNDLEQESPRCTPKVVKFEVISISDGEKVHIPTKVAGVRSFLPSTAQDTIEADPFENDYMSDDDLVEKESKETESYQNLTSSAKRDWESNRAEASFRAGHVKHFECSVQLLEGEPCTTRQEYYPSRCAARPVVSCFFGHNKNQWNQIIKSARVMLCRKCYQRIVHKAKSHLASTQLPICRELVNRIEIWRPGCRFNIKLTKAMLGRVIKFGAERKKLTRDRAAAKVDADNPNTKAADIKRAANTPVLFAIELRDRFTGNNKTSNDVHALLDWLEVKLADGTIEDLPAFEALLELRTQDRERLEAQSKRRAAAVKASGISVLSNAKKPQRSSEASETKSLTVPEQTTDLEETPIRGPLKAAATEMPPAVRTFKAINSATALNSLTNPPAASESDMSGLDILCAAAGLVRGSVAEADPFVSSIPPAPSKIMLKFGKGKMPVITNPVAEASQPRISKRKRATTLTREDSKFDEDPAPAAKKTKRTKAVLEERSREQLSVDKVVNAQTIDIGSNDQASASTEAVQQKIEIKNGATHLASLTFSGMKVIVNFGLAS